MLKKLKTQNYISSMSFILMIFITTITQVLTLLKSSMVAGYFGTSVDIDAYNFANSIVTFLFGFIASGISTVIIPAYIKKGDRRYVDTFITILYGIIAFLIILVIVFRVQIIGVFSNRDEMFVNITCNVLVVLLIANYLLALSDITVAYFQCEGKYNTPKIIAMIAQIIVIGALILVKNISIYQYTVIIAVGLVVNVFLDLSFAIKEGWRYKPAFLIKAKQTLNLFKLFLPIVFSTGVFKLSLMVDSAIAARLDVGKITILSYSSQIVNLVNTVLIGNLITYCYPKIVKRVIEGDNADMFWEQVGFFHMIVCLVITGFFVVGYEGISVLFQRGSFSTGATKAVFLGSVIYIIGQQTNVVRDLIYRYFYAKGDTKIAAYNSVFVSIVNIIVSVILVRFIGFYGIIWGTVLASTVSLIIILIKFKKCFGFSSGMKCTLKQCLINIIIGIITAMVIVCSKKMVNIQFDILSIFVFGIETLIVYLGISYTINRDVIRTIKKI